MTEEVPEEIWEFPKIGSKKQRAIYTPESMTHPAKMDTYLTRRLIKEYTKVGDVVADPMAGVGTTGVECVLLGRHAILVDIEEKFTNLCKKNLENVEKIFGKASFKPKLGKAVVITGDSRRLSNLLQQHADAIVTSPPYSQSVGHQGGLDKSDFKHGCRYRERYPKSKENIGNLKHDETVDTILTSPPYSEQLQAKADYEKRKERLAKLGHTNKTHGLLRGQKSTSKVIGGDERYSENQNNIGNLKHGSVDAVLTSPPFAESLANENPNRRKGYWKTSGGYQSGHGVETYGENKENIGNLKHDESVDVILTSPPFGEENSYQIYNGPRATNRKGDNGKTRVKKDYVKSEHLGNIAKLKHVGIADVILTSPPYSGSTVQDYGTSNKALLKFEKKVRKAFRTKGYFEYKGKKYTEKEWREINKGELKPRGFPELWAKIVRHKTQNRYNDENPENIANLNHGTVDAILTSPPYADIHQCPTNTGLTEFFRKQLEEKGYIEWNGKRYTEAEWRAINHGRIDGRSTPGVKKDAKYSENPQNIGNLPHTENVDVILTSPPYASSLKKHDEKTEETVKQKLGDAYLTPGRLAAQKRMQGGYTEITQKNNIGNLPFEPVDTVITSPPYQNAVHDTLEKRKKWKEKQLHEAKKGLPVGYSENPENIGNIKEHGAVDVILTSPPYSEGIGHSCHAENIGVRTDEQIKQTQAFKAKTELAKKHLQIKMSKQNIGSLKHGEVDAVLTSPPFGSCTLAEGLRGRDLSKQKDFLRKQHRDYKEVGENLTEEENIGYKEYGEVDAILTSPPYAECLQERGGTQHKFEKEKKIGVHYSHDKKNVGNLPHTENVDAILTSPPYARDKGGEKGILVRDERKKEDKTLIRTYSENPENIDNLRYQEIDVTIQRLRSHGRTDAKAGGPYGRSLAHPYSPDPANIGNLPKGTVDTILTSPPYGHEATASKPTKLEMEGLFKMGHSKETPLTDEDYRAWELRSKGNIAKRKLFVRVPCKPEEAQFHDTRKGRKGTIWEWTKEVKVDLNNINVQQQKNQQKGKTETYLEAMFKVYNECYKVLKPPVDWCSCDDE